jgi:hypothetical protein
VAEFTDPGTVLVELADEVLVVCPACSNRASITVWPPRGAVVDAGDERLIGVMFRPRRLVCSVCSRHEDWTGSSVSVGDDADPWFRYPLWLRTSVRGHTLWAWNDRHLDLVADVVAARQRKRPKTASPTTTLANALPKWMKAGDSRDVVLAGISRLRQRLASTNGADGPSG